MPAPRIGFVSHVPQIGDQHTGIPQPSAASVAPSAASSTAPLLPPVPPAPASESVMEVAPFVEQGGLSLITPETSHAIDAVISQWFQTYVHGSEISRFTPAYNNLKAILPALSKELKGLV